MRYLEKKPDLSMKFIFYIHLTYPKVILYRKQSFIMFIAYITTEILDPGAVWIYKHIYIYIPTNIIISMFHFYR